MLRDKHINYFLEKFIYKFFLPLLMFNTYEFMQSTLPRGADLENMIIDYLVRNGPQSANAIAVQLLYPLSASSEIDKEFFDALHRLEQRGIVGWKPFRKINQHTPGPEDVYEGRIYGIGRKSGNLISVQ